MRTHVYSLPTTGLSRRKFFRMAVRITGGTAGILLTRIRPTYGLSTDETFEDLCASLMPGHWAKANVDQFSDHWPSNGFKVSGDPRGVLRSWSASAFDEVSGDWYFWGGGHANYLGNEMYRWRTTTRRWERCCLPSHMTKVAAPGRYEATLYGVFDAPVASHCYDTMAYLPKQNKIFIGGGSPYGDAVYWRRPYPSMEKTGPYLWDVSKADPNKVGGDDYSNQDHGQLGTALGLRAWENRDRFQAGAVGYGSFNGYCDAAVESGKDVVYIGWGSTVSLAGLVLRYEFGETRAQDILTVVGEDRTGRRPGQGAAAWDPNRQHFVVVRGNLKSDLGSIILYDISHSTSTNPVPYVPVQVVDADGYFTRRHTASFGIQYDPGRDLYWLWEGEKEVYSLTPGTSDGRSGWVITQYYDPGASLYPQARAELRVFHGILGKWVYDPANDVLLGCYHWGSGDIWVYKPPIASVG